MLPVLSLVVPCAHASCSIYWTSKACSSVCIPHCSIETISPHLLTMCVAVVYPVKTVVQTKRSIYAIKQWLDSIMEGLVIIQVFEATNAASSTFSARTHPAEFARVGVAVAQTAAVQTWRLRPRDWKVCIPAQVIVLVPFVAMLVGISLIISGHGMQVHTFPLPLKLRGIPEPKPLTGTVWKI